MEEEEGRGREEGERGGRERGKGEEKGRGEERERGEGERGSERERERECAPATSSLTSLFPHICPPPLASSRGLRESSLGAFPAKATTIPMLGGSDSSRKTPDGLQLLLTRPRSGKRGLTVEGLASPPCPQEAGQEIFPRLPTPGLSSKPLGDCGLGFLAHAALVKPESRKGELWLIPSEALA